MYDLQILIIFHKHFFNSSSCSDVSTFSLIEIGNHIWQSCFHKPKKFYNIQFCPAL